MSIPTLDYSEPIATDIQESTQGKEGWDKSDPQPNAELKTYKKYLNVLTYTISNLYFRYLSKNTF